MDWIENAVICASMDNDTAREQIIASEECAEKMLRSGEISDNEAWDIFFCLLHECDERGFIEDKARMRERIDTARYNPFKSEDAGVRFLAQLRARALGLIRAERN